MVAQLTPTSAAPPDPRRLPTRRDPSPPTQIASTDQDALQSQDQFARIYERTFDAVYRYACILSDNPHEAEDLVAEAYLRAWTNRHTYQRNGRVLAWLLSITHNLSVSRARRRATATQGRRQLAHGQQATPSAEHHASQSQDTAHLFHAIRRLPTAQQQVIALRFLGGCSNGQVARALGKREDAVRALQYRALKQLRQSLEPANPTP